MEKTSIFLISGGIKPEIITQHIYEQNKFKDRGGVSIFLGQVRNDLSENGSKTREIIYSCYTEMVDKEIIKLKESILKKYEDVKEIIILHSNNSVKAGEISLFVLTSGGHRKQIQVACNQIVELIKFSVPIWKKEVYEDLTFKWS